MTNKNSIDSLFNTFYAQETWRCR